MLSLLSCATTQQRKRLAHACANLLDRCTHADLSNLRRTFAAVALSSPSSIKTPHAAQLSPYELINQCLKAAFTLVDSGNTFACATVTFRGEDEKLATCAAKAAAAAACSALGPGKTPSCLLAFTSSPEQLLRPLVAAALEATPGVPLAGCSTVALRCTRAVAGSMHVTIAAAHLPGVDVHTFHSNEDSLPALPDLAAALTSRPPQFVVLTTHDAHIDGVKDRLENLFGAGACLAVGTACLSLPTRRTAVVVPGMPGLGLFTQEDAPLAEEPSSSSSSSRWGPRLGSAASSSSSSRPWEASFLGELAAAAAGRSPEASSSRSSSGSSSSSRPPVAFCGDGQLYSSGCTGLALMPVAGPSGRLPASAAAALARVMMGQDRFSVLELPEDSLSHLRPPPTPDAYIPPACPPIPEDPAQWRPVQIPGLPSWPQAARKLPGSQADSRQAVARVTPRQHQEQQQQQQQGRQEQETATKVRSSSRGQERQQQQQQGQQQGQGERLHGLPLFEIMPSFVLFPGEKAQIRIFEKRYQLLVKQLVERGGCFGIPVAGDLVPGLGITAVVRSYKLHGSEFYVVVEGGQRFSFVKGAKGCSVLPGTFGLTAVKAVPMHDDALPPGSNDAQTAQGFAHQVLKLVHQGADDARTSQPVTSSSMFASALHLASSQPGGVPAAAARAASGDAAPGPAHHGPEQAVDPAALLAEAQASMSADKAEVGGECLMGGVGASGDAAPGPAQLSAGQAVDPAALLAEAQAGMSAEKAEALSLFLTGCMPVDMETKRSWFTCSSTVVRLREQYIKLQLRNVRTNTADEVMRAAAWPHVETAAQHTLG